jgi:pantothenate kinase
MTSVDCCAFCGRQIRFAEVAAPVYSHLAYDIVPGEFQTVRQPTFWSSRG